MENTQHLVKTWFEIWERGNFQELPLTENFRHTSPYGAIEGKSAYLELVAANRDKFLGNQFEIHDELAQGSKACVRYTVSKGDFRMSVSEWFYAEGGLIREIYSYYNIEGEISETRKLVEPAQ